jgi:hypothetical protein
MIGLQIKKSATMNQQPDKLFREKLEGFQRPAPASAWDKIEKNLDNKKPIALWWKIAASLLLIAVAAYILWPKNSQSSEAPIAKAKDEETKSLPVPKEDKVNKEEKVDDASPSSVQTPVVPSESIQKNSVSRIDKQKGQPKEKIEKPEIKVEESVANNETPLNEVIPVLENKIQHTEVAVAEQNATTEKTDERITLIVSVDEANKYLTKNKNTEATSDDKKTSSLRKLLKKASDLTNDQRPLADLRQKKDEILALNFDSKKQRGQNK